MTETPTKDQFESIIDTYREKQKEARRFQIRRPLTDTGNAERFTDQWHEIVRYNHTSKRWMVWTRKKWQTDERGHILYLAKLTVRSIYAEAEKIDDEQERKETAHHAERSEAASKIKSMLELAAGDPQVACIESDFDQDPHLLNTPAGVYNLKTAERFDHDPTMMMSKITTVAPDPDGDPTAFMDFLSTITLGRKDLQDALQRFFGSGLSGQTPKERVAILIGSGANGKGVLVEGVADILGDYAVSTDIGTLSVTRRSSGHSDDVANLVGARLVYSVEPNQGVRIDEGRVKALTGGDTLSVSRKHEKTFTFRPCGSVVLGANHLPQITGNDNGIWRRLVVVPFDYTVPEEQRDPTFKEKLIAASGPFVLAWLIAGATMWYRDGYGTFETTTKATEQYRSGENVFGRFLDDVVEINPHHRAKSGELRKAYERWCKESGYEPIYGRDWTTTLSEHGFTYERDKSGRYYRGLKVAEEFQNG